MTEAFKRISLYLTSPWSHAVEEVASINLEQFQSPFAYGPFYPPATKLVESWI